jgi:hypothetical protein
MKADGDNRLVLLVSFIMLVLSAPVPHGREQPGTPSSLETRDEREAFLSKASVVTDAPSDGRPSWRAGLDDGTRRHDASVDTEDGSGPTRRNYRFNVAAYELDKLLGLNLVPPSVERPVNGRPASVSWWVDNIAMNELDRATQQNTTLVGDLSRSADALRDSSTRLIEAVGFFRAA